MMASGSVAGGFVLLAYAATIILCAMAGDGDRTWRMIAVALAALAIEKAFHLESVLVHRLEAIAQAGHWYGERQGMQRKAIVLLVIAGIAFAAALWWSLRRLPLPTRGAACATALLVVFVAIRAVSLHRLDRLLAGGIGPLRISNVVELAALCLIGGGARAFRRTHLRGA